jgi:hypothetical protein
MLQHLTDLINQRFRREKSTNSPFTPSRITPVTGAVAEPTTNASAANALGLVVDGFYV